MSVIKCFALTVVVLVYHSALVSSEEKCGMKQLMDHGKEFQKKAEAHCKGGTKPSKNKTHFA